MANNKIGVEDLSFEFVIEHYENRTLIININKMLRNLEYTESYFGWFMEDLVFFLEKNNYKKRWDFGLIKLNGISNLKLSEKDKNDFIGKFKSVTSWDMEII